MKNNEAMNVDDLLDKPLWIMDLLPKQVPDNKAGQYFKVEKYFLKRIDTLVRKYCNIILKLNCYCDIQLSHNGDDWMTNPDPETMDNWLGACLTETPTENTLFIYICHDSALMVVERDCTHMTIYNPSEELLEMLRLLAASEGLFVWKP